MSGFRRSPFVRLQLWFRGLLRRIATSRLISGLALRVARGLRGLRLFVHRVIAPQWLRNGLESFGKRWRRAESSVARTGQQVSQTVARSAVGESAQKLARTGRRIEFRLSSFFIEGGKFLGTILGGLIPAPVRRLFGWFGWQFWRVFGVVFVFVGRWFRTRHYWHLMGGLPAFLLALPLAYCMIRMPFYTSDHKAKHYRRAAAEAMMDKDYATASLYHRKLYQLGAMNDAVQYQSALNSIETDNEAEGIEQLQQLAPETQAGFPPAHLWLARWYIDGRSSLDRDSALALAEKHLKYVFDRDPGNVEARALRARHMQRLGRLEDAASELRQVVKQIPQHGLSLAGVYARQGRMDAARREIDKVIKLFEEKAAGGDELEAYEYITWSHGYRILGDLTQAEEILKTGLENHPDEEPLTEQLHRLLIDVASSEAKVSRTDPSRSIDRLLLAAKLDPDDTEPLIVLANMAVDRSPFGRDVRRSVETLLDGDDAPPKLYAIVAPLVGIDGDMQRAVKYLRRAVSLDPQDSYSLNNLAFGLFSLGNDRNDEALRFVNQALAIEPNQALYRETRGQLFVRLGRYQEAIDDLNFALNELGDSPEIHRAMAEAYKQTGQAEAAQIHAQRAQD